MRRGLLLLLLLAPDLAPGQTIEERLRALESQLADVRQENARLRQEMGVNPERTVTPKAAAVAGPRLVFGGFIQAQAEFGGAADPRWPAVNDRFFFRRARLHVAGKLPADFDFKAELDFQGNTLSAGTGHTVRANEIFINWGKYAAANLRFGQLKPAFGAEALLSDTKMLTIERSLSSDRLADGRQLALAAAGSFQDRRFSYYAVLANGNGANVSANDNDHFQKSAHVSGRLLQTAHAELTVGAGGLWSEDTAIAKPDLGLAGNLFTGRRRMYGVDARLVAGRFQLEGEWLQGNYSPAHAGPGADFTAAGWQLTAAGFVIPGKLQAVIREEEFDPDRNRGGNEFRTVTFGLNYFIKGDDLKLMIDHLEGRTAGGSNHEARLLTRLQVIF